MVQSLLYVKGRVIFGVIGPYEAVQSLSKDLAIFKWTSDRLQLCIKGFEVYAEKGKKEGSGLHT